jgi:hypothetical protein
MISETALTDSSDPASSSLVSSAPTCSHLRKLHEDQLAQLALRKVGNTNLCRSESYRRSSGGVAVLVDQTAKDARALHPVGPEVVDR